MYIIYRIFHNEYCMPQIHAFFRWYACLQTFSRLHGCMICYKHWVLSVQDRSSWYILLLKIDDPVFSQTQDVHCARSLYTIWSAINTGCSVCRICVHDPICLLTKDVHCVKRVHNLTCYKQRMFGLEDLCTGSVRSVLVIMRWCDQLFSFWRYNFDQVFLCW